jgi:ABC-type glycerol-3-phosphate transport system substrate-binding protein
MLFWMMPDSGSNTKKDFEAFIAPFKKENPDIKIDIKIYTRQTLWNKLFSLVFEDSSAETPDLIELPHVWTSVFVKAGLLADISALDPGLMISKFLAPLAPHSYKKDTKDIYSVPWWMDVAALHYRPDHLKDVCKNPAEELATWAGLMSVCARLKEKFAKNPFYFPMQNSDWRGEISVRNVLPCIWGRGTDLFSENGKKCLFEKKEFADALEDYISLAKEGYMPILWEKGSVGTLAEGKASLFISRRLGFSIFEDKKNPVKIKTLPVPSNGKEQVSFMSGINLAVSAKSKAKPDALKLINWLTAPDKQMEYAVKMEVFPALEEKFDDFIFSSPERIRTYAKIVAGARTLPVNLVSATATKVLSEVLDDAAEKIIAGSYTRARLEENLRRAGGETDYLLGLYE